jgi:outer membrane protein assembly factor BamB
MDFGFEGFESADFEAELEDFEVRKVRKFTRNLEMTEGGSFHFSIVHKGVVYAPSGDHYVYAIDMRSGKEIWRFRTGGCNYGMPGTDGSLLYVPSYDGHVYALDLETGEEAWRFRTDGKVFASPYSSGGIVVFGSADSNVYAVESKTGRLIWKFRTGAETASSPIIHDGMVFTGSCDRNLYCIDLKTGSEMWRFTTGEDVMLNRPALISAGRIYFSSFDNYLYCVDTRTGREIWRFRTGKYGNVGPPFLHGNHLYHCTNDGIVYKLTMDGKEVWRFLAGEMTVKAVVHEGIVYFGSEDGFFYAVDDETGKERWRFHTGGKVFDDAKISGEILCFGSWDCNYYALDRRTGRLIWSFHSGNSEQSRLPPLKGMFRLEVKKTTHTGDAISGDGYKKKKEETISLSDYVLTSEYSSHSEYKQKSDYDVSFVIFDGTQLEPLIEAHFLNSGHKLILWD